MNIPAELSAELLGIALKVTLLLTLAAAIDLLVMRRKASAAARHLLWTLATVGVLSLPLVGMLLPAWHVPVLDARLSRLAAARQVEVANAPAGTQRSDLSETKSTSATRPSFESAPTVAKASDGLPPASALAEPAPGRDVPVRSTETAKIFGATPSQPDAGASLPPWGAMLLGAYLLGVFLLIARIVVERFAVRRIEREATPIPDGEWASALRTVARSLGVRRPVSLLRSGAPTVPLTWGTLRPAVLLPAGAEQWPAARREAVLLHELAHVARHDCLVQTLAALSCALYWPHPGVWLAARRLRIEREMACDDQALARGLRPRDYAGHLLEVARGFGIGSPPSVLAVSMATPSNLEARLRAVIDGRRHRAAPSTPAKLLAASLMAAVLLPLGAVWAVAAEGIVDSVVSNSGEAVAVPARTPLEMAGAPPTATVVDPRPDPVASSAAAQQQGGTWRIRMATSDESIDGAPTVHVILRTPGMNTFLVPIDSIEGLSAEALASGSGPVQFRLRRDPGTLSFEGSITDGRGAGHFTYTPDPRFSDELVRRGMQRPSSRQLFTLAIHGASLAFLDELSRLGYAVPATDELVRASLTGADAKYAREMAQLGYRVGTLRSLVSLWNNGADPQSVMRVSTDSAEARQRDRARSPSANAAPAGESGRSVRQMSDTPRRGRWIIVGTDPAELQMELQWDDDTQWRRRTSLSAFTGLAPEALSSPTSAPVAFRIDQDAGRIDFEGTFRNGRGSGDFRFEPKREFIATLRSLGIAGVDGMSDHELKNLAYSGYSADVIRGLQALDFPAISKRELLDLAVRLVTPEYAKAMQDHGVVGANTVPGIVALRFAGISADYVRELVAAGYANLSVEQVLALRRHGVTSAFIRTTRGSGNSQLTVEELLERVRAVDSVRRQRR